MNAVLSERQHSVHENEWKEHVCIKENPRHSNPSAHLVGKVLGFYDSRDSLISLAAALASRLECEDIG